MIMDFSRLPKSGVYSIVDEVAQCFYINYTSNMSGCLASIYGFERPGTTLDFRILVNTSDLTTLKLHTEYYRNMYLKTGYTEIVERGRKTLQYRARVVVASDFKYVDVELVTARGDGMVVARFKTKKEAQEFVMVYYGDDNEYRLPVYASNSLTKEFLARGNTASFTL